MAATETRMQTDTTVQDDFWRRTSHNRTVRLMILIIGTMVVVAMIYGSGMRGQKRTADALNEKRKIAQREYRLAQMDLRLRLAAMEQLEARRQLGLAENSLDAAEMQKHLAEAVRLLSDADAAQTSNADLSDVLADLKKGAGSVDFGKVATRMDAALDKQVPDLIQTSTEWDKAHPVIPPTMNDVPKLPGNDVTTPGPQ